MNENDRGLQRRGLARALKLILDFFFVLMIAVAILRVVAVSISSFTDYDEGWEFDVPVAIGEGGFYTRLPHEFAQDTTSGFLSKGISQARGTLILHHYRLPLHLAATSIILLFNVAAILILLLLRRILATTARGRPFDPLNPKRLNLLGWIILCTTALATVSQYVVSVRVLSIFRNTLVPLSPSIDFHQEWILCSLLILVLAAIWKEAVHMAEEQALTV